MRIRDWSSDVFCSDLLELGFQHTDTVALLVQVKKHDTLSMRSQMPRDMTGKHGLADATALISHYDCSHCESLQWLRHGLLVPAVMGGAVSRSEAILRLHIPWVRIVIQVKALAIAIGSASCRSRVSQFVEIVVVAVVIKKKKT